MLTKKKKLEEKLNQAEEVRQLLISQRKETQIQNIKYKANQENVKCEETKFIVDMNHKNMELDFNIKLTESAERRN